MLILSKSKLVVGADQLGEGAHPTASQDWHPELQIDLIPDIADDLKLIECEGDDSCQRFGGAFAPRILRQAQKEFRIAVEMAVEVARIQQRLTKSIT